MGNMDPQVWGNLQYYMGLERVYAKLPLKEFFKLRLVCKEWNRLAGDRDFLHENFKEYCPIPELYFFMESYDCDEKVMLAYDRSSSSWSVTQLPPCPYNKCRALEGLVIHDYEESGEGQPRLFNIHTKEWITLPPSPEENGDCYVILGMVVDKSTRPYTWKIVKGSEDVDTQIYDSRSNSWETRPSRVYEGANYNPHDFIDRQKGLACNNGVLYIQSDDEILTYDMEEDEWMNLHLPPVDALYMLPSIGAWQNHVLVLSDDITVEERTLVVWERVGLQEWTEFSRMPSNLFSWLSSQEIFPFPHDSNADIHMSYCNEYILVYIRFKNEPTVCKAEKFVLFNISTKVWAKLQLPFGVVSISKEVAL